jgi:hypothetical protein
MTEFEQFQERIDGEHSLLLQQSQFRTQGTNTLPVPSASAKAQFFLSKFGEVCLILTRPERIEYFSVSHTSTLSASDKTHSVVEFRLNFLKRLIHLLQSFFDSDRLNVFCRIETIMTMQLHI